MTVRCLWSLGDSNFSNNEDIGVREEGLYLLLGQWFRPCRLVY